MQVIDLCEVLLSKFSNIRKLDDELSSCYENQADQMGLFGGLAGILIFLGVCNRLQLSSASSELCHAYIEKMCERLPESRHDLSLHQGLTGVLFSIFLCSERGTSYRDLLVVLETRLRDQIESHLLIPIQKAIDRGYFLHPTYLNLSGGLSGIISYLSYRCEEESNRRMLCHAVQILTKYLERENPSPSGALPGWFCPQEETLYPSEKYKFPQGSYVFSQCYGVSGYLAALVRCVECGEEFGYLRNSIEKIAYWLVDAIEKNDADYILPIAASRDEVLKRNYKSHLRRDAWCAGIPSTALTLYKTGLLLQKDDLCKVALNAYVSLFQKGLKEWNLTATSLFHGRAGIMLTTYEMASLSGSDFLKDECVKLEREVMRYYHPSHEFCFRCVEVSESGNYFWRDDPGLLFGASGVLLSLMKVNGLQSCDWEKVILLS